MQIKVMLHDGKEFTTTIEDYNAVELVELINDQSKYALVIGHIILSRNAIKLIAPADEVILGSTK